MQVGISVPHVGPLVTASFIRDYCQAAEEAGFDGLWTFDHIVAPQTTRSHYTLGRTYVEVADNAVSETMGINFEQNTTLSFIAAVTEQIRLGTAVAVLSIRNPVLNARQLATIDQYAGGRLTYGVGVGWLREEAEAMGMPWDQRGRRADEHITLMRTLWAADTEAVEFTGQFWTLPPMDPRPRPAQTTIPILIGGHSAAALDRVARLGDGWIAAPMSVARFTELRADLARRCEAVARDVGELEIVCGAAPVQDTQDPQYLIANAEGIVDALQAYARAGAGHVWVGRPGHISDTMGAIRWLDIFGEQILPRLHTVGR
jgi:probable F420-dependent oxidoreductase